MGIAQARKLRRRVPQAFWWWVAVTVGAGLLAAVPPIQGDFTTSDYVYMRLAMATALGGTAQALLLARYLRADKAGA